MKASLNARELARAHLVTTIKDSARNRVAVEGAARLSVRAVARDVGMVSSAIYRYFPTRNDLLTALIVDAYDALGAAVERADEALPVTDLRGRWRATCNAVRGWAMEHPHEYALIFGSPIPDYQAPADTIAPASRVPAVLLAVMNYGCSVGAITPSRDAPPPTMLDGQLDVIAMELAPDVPRSVILRFAVAWTQLFGMVTFELFGQFVGTLEPADEFFATSVELMADFLGMRRDQ